MTDTGGHLQKVRDAVLHAITFGNRRACTIHQALVRDHGPSFAGYRDVDRALQFLRKTKRIKFMGAALGAGWKVS